MSIQHMIVPHKAESIHSDIQWLWHHIFWQRMHHPTYQCIIRLSILDWRLILQHHTWSEVKGSIHQLYKNTKVHKETTPDKWYSQRTICKDSIWSTLVKSDKMSRISFLNKKQGKPKVKKKCVKHAMGNIFLCVLSTSPYMW